VGRSTSGCAPACSIAFAAAPSRSAASSRKPAGSRSDAFAVELSDRSRQELTVGAVYDRAAGLGDLVLDPDFARGHAPVAADAAVFVAGSDRRALDAYASQHPVRVLEREQYLRGLEVAGQRDRWGVWLIIALAAAFAALALVNLAAMATGERRDELATIRLLGGSRGHAVRMVLLEMAPTVLTAQAAGAVIVGAALAGVPRGLTGEPLAAPLPLLAGLVGGAVALGMLASVVSARISLRASPAAALRLSD
jgi:putative ABC transport system permease protein